MGKAFVYGMSVGGDNFTDRIEETKRIKLDFENGINVILISPRRMGKTSLIKRSSLRWIVQRLKSCIWIYTIAEVSMISTIVLLKP